MDKTVFAPLQNLSRYRIDSVLGSGAMGMVYHGYDTQIERTVAIKVLHPHLKLGEYGHDLEQRFLQEARAAARCLHPNIVTIFDFGTEGDTSFIVMEFVDGTELKAHLENNTSIPLSSATDICIQILEALSHAHEKGVIHRDIKPANIILLENGTIKVSDFGVARLDSSDLTGTGLMVGTPNYMSPEGFQGLTVDARSDLYSVGVLFYELLARKRPVREEPLQETLDKLDSVPGLSAQNVRSLKPILNRALQADPAARFQSAAEFVSVLKTIEDMDLSEAGTTQFPTLKKRQPQPLSPAAGSSASQWSGELLSSLEQSLAKYVGPMAKLLIRKQSKTAASVEELVSGLTQHIPNENERSQFKRTLDKTGITTAGAGPVSTAPEASSAATELRREILPAPTLEELTRQLAFYLGPLAGRVVKKTLKSAADADDLVQRLARQIPDEQEREKFLDAAVRLI